MKYTFWHCHLYWYYLDSFLEKLKAITRMRDNNEAYARVVIDQILVDFVMQEKSSTRMIVLPTLKPRFNAQLYQLHSEPDWL